MKATASNFSDSRLFERMSSSQDPVQAQGTKELFSLSLNPSAKNTIAFLHGIFCSHLEFALVAPYLSDYHLLLIDLPAHSRSQAHGPFTPQNSAEELATLVRNRAHGGRVHVVGLSAGGFVGMKFAIQYPELVSSLWISGATPFRGWSSWLAAHPRILYLVIASFVKWMPNWIYNFMCRRVGMQAHDDLRAEIQSNFSMDLLRTGYGSIAEIQLHRTMQKLGKTGIRTLTIAGELQDDVAVVKQMGRGLRDEGSTESKAAIAKNAVHAWDLQFPKRFAESIRSWIEEQNQPEGIEEVE